MDSSASEVEQRIAGVLATSLADREWWDLAESLPADAPSRRLLAERAVSLYAETSPVIRARIFEEAGPVDRAVAIIRDIADGAAIRSYVWPGAALYAPTRAAIGLETRLYEVDEWARGLGHPLAALGSGVPDEAWNADPSEPDSELDLATTFSEQVEAYDTLLDLWADGVEGLQGDEFRGTAASWIAGARGLLVWTRSHEPDAEVVTAVVLLMAQSMFISSWAAAEETAPFPSRDEIRQILTAGNARDWLGNRIGELPDWIS